jgi:hypothetical protein
MIPTFGWGPSAVAARISLGDERCPREAANLSGVGVGNTSNVTAGRVFPALVPRLSTLCAVLLATMVAGCARHPDRQTRAAASETRICQSAKVELAPLPPPDCKFRASNLETVDPEGFARLKAAYERQCYQRAEKAARDRLRRLQASKGC